MLKPRHLPPKHSEIRTRDDDGLLLCRCGCGRPLEPPRTSFFEDSCVNRLLIAKNPTDARAAVLERDKGVCAKCGLDCLKVWGEILDCAPMKAVIGHPPRRVSHSPNPALFRLLLARHGLTDKSFARRRSLWDCDHIQEVVNGGGCARLENLQTLCVRCHKEKTAQLNRRPKSTH